MLTGLDLQTALSLLPTCSVEGILYRAVDLEALFGFHKPIPYTQLIPPFSEGSSQRGARYTPISGPASLYLAMDPQTAYAEANRVHTRAWIDAKAEVPALPPTVLISVQAHLDTILDLIDAAILQALNTTNAELMYPWRLAQSRGHSVATQILGQAVFDNGRFQAIRFPSSQSSNASCLVVFPIRLTTPAYLETIGPYFNIVQKIP